MTICNMSIEAGARAGMVAPDDTTFAYLEGRPGAPSGAAWERAVDDWRALASDDEAVFDREVVIDAGELKPQVTWGTNPGMVAPVDGRVPDPAALDDPDDRDAAERALAYMALEPGTPIAEIPIDRVFIGSCTNSRIEDLRVAAAIVDGRQVHPSVRAMVVPGSAAVRRQAEEEGLDRVFLRAGFEWRLAGCSMCLGMNPDVLAPGERCASTSNRNFEGRQGRGGRTHLVSPAMAAAAAVAGRFVDVRELGVKPVTRVAGRVAVLDRADIDTDQIIPKQFLKRIERTGYGEFLFYDWRQDPGFELNRPEYAGAPILLAGRNFGCGSSREHAAWALQDYGFDAVVAPSFGDIFASNSAQIGLLTITLPAEQIRELAASREVEIDVEQQTIGPFGFDLDPFLKHRLLNGLDDIGLTLAARSRHRRVRVRPAGTDRHDDAPGLREPVDAR